MWPGDASRNAAPGTHRFVATPALRTGGAVYGGVVGVNLLVVALAISPAGACFGASSAGLAGTLASVVLFPLATWLVFVAYRSYRDRPRTVRVDVGPEGLVVDEGRGGAFPLAGVVAGPWQLPSFSVSAGTALHFRNGARAFCLGGYDHRPPPWLRLDAPPVQAVDASVPPAELDRLLTVLASHASVPARAPVGEPAVLRCVLTPSRSSTRFGLSVVLPWFLALALGFAALAGVGFLFDALGGGEASAWRQRLQMAVLLPIVAGGMVLTFWRSMRSPRPRRALEIDGQVLRLVDLGTSAVLASAPLASVGAARRYGGGEFTEIVLELRIPGSRAITVTTPGDRFVWTDARTPFRAEGAAYVVGGADWLSLVRRLGLESMMHAAGMKA